MHADWDGNYVIYCINSNFILRASYYKTGNTVECCYVCSCQFVKHLWSVQMCFCWDQSESLLTDSVMKMYEQIVQLLLIKCTTFNISMTYNKHFYQSVFIKYSCVSMYNLSILFGATHNLRYFGLLFILYFNLIDFASL